MPVKNYPCSIEQTMNFKRDVQAYCGIVSALTIGTTALTADLKNIVDPTNVTSTSGLTAVGVLSGIHFDGGQTSNLDFEFAVSTANQVSIQNMLDQGLSNTQIKINFTCYYYDPVKAVYYQCYWSNNAEMTGVIAKEGDELAISVDVQPYHGIKQPLLYLVRLSVSPNPGQNQSIHIANSSTAKNVIAWGVANA
jgi:hypothetical protein